MTLASLAGGTACDQNMSDSPLPRASAEDVADVAARLTRAPSLSVPAGSTISGLVEIAPGIAGVTAPGDVVFVIARDPATEGPPVAVERLTGNRYPIRFVLDLTGGSAGAAPGRELQLLVKVDRDGDANTSSPEDLVGVSPDLVEPGESDARIVVEATLGEVMAMAAEDRGESGPAGRREGSDQPSASAESATSNEPRIAGTLELPPALRARTSPSDVIFVIARRPGGQRPPVAVARLQGNRYPMEFTLGDGDRMLGGDWPDALDVEVRLDRDGDPMTRDPEDLTGRAPAPVRTGSRNVRIELTSGG